MYNGVLSDFLTQALGWGWKSTRRPHSQVPKCEVASVPEELQKGFSTGSSAIEIATNAMIPDFVALAGCFVCTDDVAIVTFSATLAGYAAIFEPIGYSQN